MAWTLGHVRGIAIRIHWTLLLVLPLFAYAMAVAYFAAGDNVTTAALLWGTGLAVALFASVLVHEFSHSLMAQRLGGSVGSILLMPLGGVSQMESLPERPRAEFLTTVVGPLTNFVIALPLLLVAGLDLVPTRYGDLGTFVLWIGILNLALGAFNLFLPAFPMDGGRILRAALSTRMGRRKATHAAAVTGRTVAVLLGVAGVFAFGVGGVWLILIAFFIFLGAGVEERQETAHALLGDLEAQDLMTPDPATVAPTDTLASVQQTMWGERHTVFPVEEAHRLVGCLGLQEMEAVPPGVFDRTLARDAMRSDVATVSPDTAAVEVLKAVQKSDHHHVLVVEGDRVVGVVALSDVERVLKILHALEDKHPVRPQPAPQPGRGHGRPAHRATDH